jgi:hypothetical protein
VAYHSLGPITAVLVCEREAAAGWAMLSMLLWCLRTRWGPLGTWRRETGDDRRRCPVGQLDEVHPLLATGPRAQRDVDDHRLAPLQGHR